MRTARLVLWRFLPPFRKTVQVRRITIGGFLDLVRTVAPKAAAAVVQSDKPLTDVDLIRAAADAETMAYFADLVAVDHPVGFLRGWLRGRLAGVFARRNTEALLAACRRVEGDGQWTRFLGQLTRPGQAGSGKPQRGKGGGLMADVLTLSGLMGVDPVTVLSWPMQDFLSLCDALNMAAQERVSADPTMDPDAEPSAAVGIPGLWQVH